MSPGLVICRVSRRPDNYPYPSWLIVKRTVARTLGWALDEIAATTAYTSTDVRDDELPALIAGYLNAALAEPAPDTPSVR